MLENEKLEWLGRQIRILKAKPGEVGKKECEGNAKQMQSEFVTPDEQEVLKFFIHDGGEGGGNGPEAKGDANGDAVSGGGKCGAAEKEITAADGRYEIAGSSDGQKLLGSLVPMSSPHRLLRGKVADDGFLHQELGASYGFPFFVEKYGNKITFDMK